MKQLIAVSQKNKQNRTLCSTLQFTGKFTSKNLLVNFNFKQVSLLDLCQ